MSQAMAALAAAIRQMNDLLLQVTDDLTFEQANWLPPGTANPIAHTYAHIVTVQDRYLNTLILGQPTIAEREGWNERLNLPLLLRLNRETASQHPIDLRAFRPYTERVFAETNAYLERADEAELARVVQGVRGPLPVGELLGRFMTTHAAMHLGEICALKGIQGLKGLPF